MLYVCVCVYIYKREGISFRANRHFFHKKKNEENWKFSSNSRVDIQHCLSIRMVFFCLWKNSVISNRTLFSYSWCYFIKYIVSIFFLSLSLALLIAADFLRLVVISFFLFFVHFAYLYINVCVCVCVYFASFFFPHSHKSSGICQFNLILVLNLKEKTTKKVESNSLERIEGNYRMEFDWLLF